jgi:hypothetical protein
MEVACLQMVAGIGDPGLSGVALAKADTRLAEAGHILAGGPQSFSTACAIQP